MAKLTLTDIAAGYLSITVINANNALLEAALENTLSRDGTSPNTMSAALDMNSNLINNLTDGVNAQDAVSKAQLDLAALGSLTNITLTEQLSLTEQAAAAADIASIGQIWVKTGTPNTLWFTDDAGTDVQLGVAAAAETNDLSAAVTWANVPDANITEGSVTQHEAALSVTESQISDLGTYLTSVALTDLDNGTDGELITWDAAGAAAAVAVGTAGHVLTSGGTGVAPTFQAAASAGGVSGAKAFGSGNQAIVTATETAIAFNSESFDTDTIHDTVTNNSRLTVPTGVTRIRLKGHVQWAANGSAMRTLRIRRDGSNANTLDDAMAGCTPVNYMSAAGASVEVHGQDIDSGTITVTATDYFELVVEQTSGGNLNLLAGDYWFEMEVIE